LESKLTLISSPAGFGKTTLLSEFAVGCDLPIAWLSIDEDDNDTTRFIAYLIAALSRVKGGFGESVYPVLQTPKPERIESLLTVLINEIAAEFPPFILVFDDYHLITSSEIHEVLAFIIEHQPEQMHVMIATRADPSLPISRLRARDQLTKIRENDLRFTDDEAADFLTRVMGLDLRAEELSAMERRTEGWAAGLQLAALSLQEHADKENFVKSFAGSNR
jgi:LuxR family maltose regulon positive regulatory protein